SAHAVVSEPLPVRGWRRHTGSGRRKILRSAPEELCSSRPPIRGLSPMARQLAKVRDAVPDDAPALLVLWHDLVPRRTDDPLEHARGALARVAADPGERILVVEWAYEVIGSVQLRRVPIAPLGDEMAILVSHLQVLTGHRRQGVGHLLLEAAVAWAEEKNVGYLSGIATGSRDTNRFLARLGLGQTGVLRGAPVSAVRARLGASDRRGATARGGRHVGLVLASRRSQRRRTEGEG